MLALARFAPAHLVGLALVSLAGPSAAAPGADLPPPIASMVQKGKGVQVLSRFDGPSGLTGFVVTADGGERRIYYVTPDGQTALYGIAFDASLTNVTASHVARFAGSKTVTMATAAVSAPAASAETATSSPAERAYALAERGMFAFVEGAPNGLDLYVVFDPSCPFCHRTFRDTRAMTRFLRIHWIPVAELRPESANLVEALAKSTDPMKAMVAMANDQLQPSSTVRGVTSEVLAQNRKILDAAGVKNVPLLLYRAGGTVKQIVGAPSAAQLAALAAAVKQGGR